MEFKFKKLKEVVKKGLSCSAHDFDHVMRVYKMSLRLAENENPDMEVLRAAVLLHDIARTKEDNDAGGTIDHAIRGAQMAEEILLDLNFPKEKIKHVKDCIRSHRYRNNLKPKSIEAKILFDADKLDSLGAIGVARAFVWVGKNNAKIHSPASLDEYIQDNQNGAINGKIKDKTKHSPQIEFEAKLKFLTKKLLTKKAKEIGRERTVYLKEFFNRLDREVGGEL